jgi:hypothetical protein
MVCDKCIVSNNIGTSKLGKLITPDVRIKEEIMQNKSSRKVNANMLLDKYKNR